MAGHQTRLSTFNFDMNVLATKLLRWAVFGLSCFATIEMASRIDQWVVYGAPVFGLYTYDSALFTNDEFGIRGKSNGHYEKWKLNSLGFRGPELSKEKEVGRLRIAVIGASETFGLHEPINKEWPRQLEDVLAAAGVRSEVVNAAMAGMSFPQRTRHLEKRLLPLKPDVVVFMVEYGSYAGITEERIRLRRERPPMLSARDSVIDGLKAFRTVSRLKDVLLPRLPEVVRGGYERSEQWIKLEMKKKEMGGKFRSILHMTPFESEALVRDLDQLRTLAESNGTKLVLVSPAMWFTGRNFDLTYLSWPFLDESWWREAGSAFPRVVRDYAEQSGIPFVDLSDVVQGHESEWMKDMLHFNEWGAHQVAFRIAREISPNQAVHYPH